MLRDEAGVDVALEQAGGFHICLSEAEMRARVDALGKLMAQPGFETYLLKMSDRGKTGEERNLVRCIALGNEG